MTSMRRIGLGLCACALLVASGCKKESPPPEVKLVAQIQWLGMDRLGSETNAAGFMTIWREPESRKLLAQTLDKLDNWMSGATNSTTSNARLDHGPNAKPAAQSSPLRPLLDDLVQSQSYIEVRQVANSGGDLLLAVRLNPERAALWETNLATAIGTFTGTRPATAAGTYGWQAELRGANAASAGSKDPARFLRLSKSGDWTLLGLSHDAKFASFPATFTPPPAGTNYWIQGDIDLANVAQALGLDCKPPANMPRVNFNAIGDGANVISHGELSFAQPLGLAIQPWNIPTNLINGNLVSLTAMRGVAPWLGKLTLFSNVPPANLPDQMYVWGRSGLPFQTFFALTVSNAALALNDLAGPITNWANSHMLAKDGNLSLDKTNEVLAGIGVPHVQPFLRAVTNTSPQYLYGGFAPELRPIPMPHELQEHIVEATNLVYFNWEVAGEMLAYWRYLDDVYRIAFDNFGPRLSGTASLKWIATNLTNLSHTVTEVRLESPNRISFVRKSTVGLNSVELDALANWLEMPEFPRGLGHLMDTNPLPSFSTKLRQIREKHAHPQQGAPPH